MSPRRPRPGLEVNRTVERAHLAETHPGVTQMTDSRTVILVEDDTHTLSGYLEW